MNSTTIDEEQILTVLKSAGCQINNISLQSIPRGANNRVFLLDANGEQLVAKYYYRHPDDPRDRLFAEYSLLTYASDLGIDNIPHPVVQDAKTGVGIYSYVEGKQFTAADVNRASVIQAAKFFHALNRDRNSNIAQKLPVASEACFSIAEHCHLIERRIFRLKDIKPSSKLNKQAIDYVRRLQHGWNGIRDDIMREAEQADIPYDEELPRAQRCISPSDFGFHNALVAGSEKIVFLDFEYAGWDDPAKMGADFFCQPELPVPLEFMPVFLDTAFESFPKRDYLVKRSELLLPAYRVKWCCILLNEFLPDSASRRHFAKGSEELQQRKETQLEKAEKLLKNFPISLT